MTVANHTDQDHSSSPQEEKLAPELRLELLKVEADAEKEELQHPSHRLAWWLIAVIALAGLLFVLWVLVQLLSKRGY
ncbi:MAG: hypothetical protein PHQ27_00220 [Victivallales bacterium]|nr:hypothetical protein [Victivallales bacterium]